MKRKTRITLDSELFPKKYVNIIPYLNEPLAPPLNPATNEPLSPDALEAIFAKECIRQEVSTEKNIAIPEEIRSALTGTTYFIDSIKY